MPLKQKIYQKHQSFKDFKSFLKVDIASQEKRVIAILEQYLKNERNHVLASALKALKEGETKNSFKINQYIADELSKIEDCDVTRYIMNRYRYDVFPKTKELDKYPPYLQIEPASVCNYRCVFCYQTDKTFSGKTGGHMGFMKFDLFKKIIDEIKGNIEFLSLASRGEPMLCPDINKMLEYCRNKFLGLKVNTNGSIMSEENCRMILSGGVNTLVFSVDAANEKMYSKFRVNGDFKKVYENIKRFSAIKNKEYPKSRIITRVSGVSYGDNQNMDDMIKVWGDFVDQISFVKYNPWENVYDAELNDIKEPCSDLWRRMFIWFDGKVNPCDTDYKSTLSLGNLEENSISKIWTGELYENIRKQHLDDKRLNVSPCQRCVVL